MRTWGGEYKITVFSDLFEVDIQVDIQVYRYATSIVTNHEYIHLISNLTEGFTFEWRSL